MNQLLQIRKTKNVQDLDRAPHIIVDQIPNIIVPDPVLTVLQIQCIRK